MAGSKARQRLLGVIAGLALGLPAAGFSASQPAPEPTINKSEIWAALYPDSPTDPNNPNNKGDSSGGVSPENGAGRRYHWNYSRTNPATGLPQQIPEGDQRMAEIDGYRIQCINLVSQYYDENHLPDHIPRSQFDNLEDQATEMVLACMNHLHIKKESWLKGFGAIVCEQHTNHCWGPNDVWVRRTPAGPSRRP